eukprot:36733-Hanusia_phi.AAC.1
MKEVQEDLPTPLKYIVDPARDVETISNQQTPRISLVHVFPTIAIWGKTKRILVRINVPWKSDKALCMFGKYQVQGNAIADLLIECPLPTFFFETLSFFVVVANRILHPVIQLKQIHAPAVHNLFPSVGDNSNDLSVSISVWGINFQKNFTAISFGLYLAHEISV